MGQFTRRRLLGALGATTLAGCGGRTPSTDRRTSDGADATRTYHVAPDGSDGGGSSGAEAVGSLNEAVGLAGPGDLVTLGEGVYRPESRLVVQGASGTAERPVRLVGAGPGRTRIEWADGADAGGIRLDGVSHWHVADLEIRNSPMKGLQILNPSATENVVSNVVVSGCSNTGLEVLGGSNNHLVDVVSHGNFDHDNAGEDADGVKVAGTEAVGNRLTRALAFRNADDGIDLWTSRDTVLDHCESRQNGYSPNGDGFGFKLGGAGSGEETGGHRLVRCVSFGNWQKGFGSNGSSMPLTLYNNTAVANPLNFVLDGADHVAVNNLAWNGEREVVTPVRSRSNSWNVGIDAPQFRTTDPSSAAFLHLTSGSPAIDAGRDVGLKYAGDAPDLGAFEFGM